VRVAGHKLVHGKRDTPGAGVAPGGRGQVAGMKSPVSGASNGRTSCRGSAEAVSISGPSCSCCATRLDSAENCCDARQIRRRKNRQQIAPHHIGIGSGGTDCRGTTRGSGPAWLPGRKFCSAWRRNRHSETPARTVERNVCACGSAALRNRKRRTCGVAREPPGNSTGPPITPPN